MTNLADAQTLLCVQPHYDDNDLGAGGTIAALAEQGAHVVYVTVTNDLVGVLDPELTDAEATKQLRAEQAQAGEAIGVAEQVWLDFPDAGPIDYYELRRRLIVEMRRVRPDWVLTVDPWLPYEAHSDHLVTGRAVAEASFLQRHPRFKADPVGDRSYEPRSIDGVAFYFTREPNLVFDITKTRKQKHEAIDAYRAQFTPAELELLHKGLDAKEQQWAEAEAFSHGEALKALPPGAFHVSL